MKLKFSTVPIERFNDLISLTLTRCDGSFIILRRYDRWIEVATWSEKYQNIRIYWTDISKVRYMKDKWIRQENEHF